MAAVSTCPATASQSTVAYSSTLFGSFDGATCGTNGIVGWACDSNHPAATVQVDFYNGAYRGSSSNAIGTTIANLDSPDRLAIDKFCGGQAAHRFSFTLPASLQDGACHSIFAYVHGAVSGVALVQNSPRSLTCAAPQAPTITPSPTGPSVSESPSPAAVAGDITGDGKVDLLDYNALMSCYTVSVSQPTASCPNPKAADLNGDGVVDGLDYNMLLRYMAAQQ